MFVGVTGTYWSRIFLDAGLMQLGLMMLPATHGRPVISSIGCPVRGSVGFLIAARPVKSPARCAAEGSVTCDDPVSGRSSRR